MADIDVCIIGAGIVGLGVGRALALGGQSVIVLEKNHGFGEETSSRNSEVIHAGMYYPKDTLKARFCVRGNRMIYDYCAPRGIMANPITKFIVATNDSEIKGLEAILQKGNDNGVPDLEIWDGARVKTLEPALNAVAAIYSPTSGIVDSHSMMLGFLGDIEDSGGFLVKGTPFEHAERKDGVWHIKTGGESPTEITANALILSAGLWSEEVAKRVVGLENFVPKMRYGKGNYFRYMGKAPFSRLIYPLPTSTALGIHLTPDAAGHARFGPDMEESQTIDYHVDENKRDKFANSIRQYWSQVDEKLLSPDYAGIRPKIGNSLHDFEDFRILFSDTHSLDGLVCLFGIDSPGLTSSMAIGEYIAEKLR